MGMDMYTFIIVALGIGLLVLPRVMIPVGLGLLACGILTVVQPHDPTLGMLSMMVGAAAGLLMGMVQLFTSGGKAKKEKT
jgi:hypothetical protein